MSNVTDVGCAGILQQQRTASVAIKPGMLLERDGAVSIKPHATEGAVGQIIFADNSVDLQTMRDGEYDIGDTVMFRQYKSGDLVNGILASGESVAEQGELASNGDGYLKASVAASVSTGVIADDNAITFTAVSGGKGGNDIAIALIDPSANDQELSTSVEGLLVKVSLKTGGAGAIESTAAEVIAAINADDAAILLLTADDNSTSDGSGVVEAVAATNLAGGSDTIGYAKTAVDASAAAADCVIRIK
jgi:hypothetical protein